VGVELLATGSVIAAFFAGGVALFAPCCIVFLAPSYLAAATKNRRWKLLPLTFVFAAGLALVLVPITLGVGFIAGAIAKYHEPVYYAGAALMIGLAFLTLSGKMWSLPSFVRSPSPDRNDTASFFSLGVFSGVASSCCAPVLAGVMTLSALSGSTTGGLILGLAYVFGMTFPLFIMALVWDKVKVPQISWLRARPVELKWRTWHHTTSTLNIALAAGFVVMGVWIAALAKSTQMDGGGLIPLSVGEWLAQVFGRIQEWLSPIPEALLGALLLALVAAFVIPAVQGSRNRRRAEADALSLQPGTDTTLEKVSN